MKRPKILVVGSFVMDLIVRANRFVQPGETILGTDFQTAPGGKGANQAFQAARLGAEVTMVGKVGDDAFGREMLASLQCAGVNVEHVPMMKGVASGIGNIQLSVGDSGSQNRIIVVPGANQKLTDQDVQWLAPRIGDYDMVMLQLEIPMEINELVAQYAYDSGVPVMLNPAPSAPLSDVFLRHVRYISPNEHEARDLTGVPLSDEADVRRATEVLRRRGVQNVLITLGEKGAAFDGGNGLVMTPCVRAERVADPTAAGDSFLGAFCTALCAGLQVRPAMEFANQTASITVSRMGAQPSLPTLAAVNDALRRRGQPTLVF